MIKDGATISQARIIYDLYAMGSGHPCAAPEEHPEIVMNRLASNLDFKILDSVPQSIGDCWWFWVEYSKDPDWPPYIKKTEWLPVGTT